MLWTAAGKIVRKFGPKVRTTEGLNMGRRIFFIVLVSGTPQLASPSAPDTFFLQSYEKALNLLSHTKQMGGPMLETSYDSLHLFETCAQAELSRGGQKRASELLNQKLTSPSFARSYRAYRQSPKKTFSTKEVKTICSALAQNRPS